jgi:hypothetical protein
MSGKTEKQAILRCKLTRQYVMVISTKPNKENKNFARITYLNLADLKSLVRDTQLPSITPAPLTVGLTVFLQAT